MNSWFQDSDWTLVMVRGADRVDFLHRLTTNILPKSQSPLVHNFFLSVNAKIQAEFWVSAHEEFLALLTPSSQVQALKECIDRYHFGEKIDVSEPEGSLFVVIGEAPPGPELVFHPDPRYGEDCYWCFVTEEQVAEFTDKLGEELPETERERRRIALGRPKAGVDYDDTSLFVEVAQQDDFSETKGCYPGQEIVARVLHRGRLNKHLRAFESDTYVPTGWHLKVDGKEVARVTSTVSLESGGSSGYLMVRREYGTENETLNGVDNEGKEYTLTVKPRAGEVLTGNDD